MKTGISKRNPWQFSMVSKNTLWLRINLREPHEKGFPQVDITAQHPTLRNSTGHYVTPPTQHPTTLSHTEHYL